MTQEITLPIKWKEMEVIDTCFYQFLDVEFTEDWGNQSSGDLVDFIEVNYTSGDVTVYIDDVIQDVYKVKLTIIGE